MGEHSTHGQMPAQQTNVPFQPSHGLMMRVGVPHRGGRLAFHAFSSASERAISPGSGRHAIAAHGIAIGQEANTDQKGRS